MESRLPKPKFGVKKTASSTNIATEKTEKFEKVEKSANCLRIPQSKRTMKDVGKSKSGENISTNVTKENKPPASKPISRARTLANIQRPVASAPRTAVKRPGPATNAVAAKRPNIVKPVVKATTSAINSIAAKAISGKSLRPTAAAATKALPAKVSKWDWKGRFELVNKDFTMLKEKHKEVIEQRDEMQMQVDKFREQEDNTSSQISTLESKNNDLNEELTGVIKDMKELTDRHMKTTNELVELKDSYEKATKSLKEYQELCEAQKQILSEHSDKMIRLESTVESQAKTVDELNGRVKDLQNLCHDMDKDRRVLHNTIQEMKGNIRVFCRVRPRISNELCKTMCAISYIDESTLEIGRADGSDSISCSGKLRGVKQEFSFDKVFPPTASQADIFEELALLVQSALEGYNVCVFAYGQTGSGKTYTMEGIPESDFEGMIPRTVRHIFLQMKEFELLGWGYKIEASFLEIYNEHIVDLLDGELKMHEIRMVDSKGTDLYVTNLQVESINSPEELHECLRTAQLNRAVAATKSNERSSRSHSVARIRLIGTHKEKGEMSIGNLNLVDLAGSERLRGEETARHAETKNINKSLANLGNVILALLKKQDHIPYRNSKLTHLLMPSLGGNSKTLMLLNVSPLDDCYNETLNSLRFASNVNNCKLGNVKRSKTIIQNTNGNSTM